MSLGVLCVRFLCFFIKDYGSMLLWKRAREIDFNRWLANHVVRIAIAQYINRNSMEYTIKRKWSWMEPNYSSRSQHESKFHPWHSWQNFRRIESVVVVNHHCGTRCSFNTKEKKKEFHSGVHVLFYSFHSIKPFSVLILSRTG